MFRLRSTHLAAALLAAALPVITGCSSSGSSSSTTTSTKAPTTTIAPSGLPATGSVDGFTLSVTSSPAHGVAGHTTIEVRAVLSGTVTPGSLVFQVSKRAAADVGQPSTNQRVTVRGPGTFVMPRSFTPPSAGTWASSVTFTPNQAGASKLDVSGLPPVAGAPSPFPQLVTLVTAA